MGRVNPDDKSERENPNALEFELPLPILDLALAAEGVWLFRPVTNDLADDELVGFSS